MPLCTSALNLFSYFRDLRGHTAALGHVDWQWNVGTGIKFSFHFCPHKECTLMTTHRRYNAVDIFTQSSCLWLPLFVCCTKVFVLLDSCGLYDTCSSSSSSMALVVTFVLLCRVNLTSCRLWAVSRECAWAIYKSKQNYSIRITVFDTLLCIKPNFGDITFSHMKHLASTLARSLKITIRVLWLNNSDFLKLEFDINFISINCPLMPSYMDRLEMPPKKWALQHFLNSR